MSVSGGNRWTSLGNFSDEVSRRRGFVGEVAEMGYIAVDGDHERKAFTHFHSEDY